jgi:hypothetical protein
VIADVGEPRTGIHDGVANAALPTPIGRNQSSRAILRIDRSPQPLLRGFLIVDRIQPFEHGWGDSETSERLAAFGETLRGAIDRSESLFGQDSFARGWIVKPVAEGAVLLRVLPIWWTEGVDPSCEAETPKPDGSSAH